MGLATTKGHTVAMGAVFLGQMKSVMLQPKIDMITIEQIKELKAKATPGEWEIVPPVGEQIHWTIEIEGGSKHAPVTWSLSEANTNFIAALPSIAQLCIEQAEELERLREQRARCLDVCYKSDGMEICKNCGLE